MNDIVEYQEKNTQMCISEEKKQLIRKMIAPNLNDLEFEVFLHSAFASGLDPLRKQIYPMKIGGNMLPYTGIDGLRSIAERTGKYAPGRATEFVFDDKGRLISATAYVKKMTADGTWHEISEVAFLSEYNSNKNLWKNMPAVMLSKSAESRALRRAFPQIMSAIYCEDELDQATHPAKKCTESNEDKDELDQDTHSEKKCTASNEEVYIDESQIKHLHNLFLIDEEIGTYVINRLRSYNKIDDIRKIPKKIFDSIVCCIEKKLKEKEDRREEVAS